MGSVFNYTRTSRRYERMRVQSDAYLAVIRHGENLRLLRGTVVVVQKSF